METNQNERKANSLIAIDLFAGAGGLTIGLKWAGFRVPFALEKDEWACDTLRYNNPDITVLQANIRDAYTNGTILSVCPVKPDVIVGGPPCQGFSVSGPARKDPNDPRNSLFKYFAKWVEVFGPKVFLMENVKGLLSRRTAQGQKVIGIICKLFNKLGYYTSVWVLNAADYGVPQIRRRVFIIGTQFGILPPPPRTTRFNTGNREESKELFSDSLLPPTPTLWEAISDLPVLEAREGSEEQPYDQPPRNEYQQWARSRSSALYNHVAMQHTKRIVARFQRIKWEESSADAPPEYGPRQRSNNATLSGRVYDQNNRRLHPSKPSHTITACFYANFIHPYQHRNFTAREAGRIQSFPDHYRFMGKKTVVSHKLLHREGRHREKHLCQYAQIGNAVPPLLSKAIWEYLKQECNLCLYTVRT